MTSAFVSGCARRNDFALVAMLGLLGLRMFEATSVDIGDIGEEHGHRVLRVCGKGTKIVLVPLPSAVGVRLFLPPDYARATASSYPVFIALQTRISTHDR